jgi:hypothetical protein
VLEVAHVHVEGLCYSTSGTAASAFANLIGACGDDEVRREIMSACQYIVKDCYDAHSCAIHFA